MARPEFAKTLRIIQRRMRSMLEQQISSRGISESQLEYLFTIYENEGINQAGLADQLEFGKTAVTKAVKILEKDGLIFRRRDPDDGRNYKLHTTGLGKETAEEVSLIFGKVQARIFSEFSIEEIEELTILLERLKESFSDYEKPKRY